MRVIAGAAKGRTLASVPGDSTRPITDRVKAALFSILHSLEMIEDRRYLDLFGGTGAVGIEALSRGAAAAVFCERDRLALKTLRRNLEATELAEQATVVPGDAFAYLQRPGLAPFDVIYIAPPQYQGLWLRALQIVDARPELLTAEGIVIVQVFPKEWSPPALSHLTLFDQRRYGSTELFFLAPSAPRSLRDRQDADSSMGDIADGATHAGCASSDAHSVDGPSAPRSLCDRQDADSSMGDIADGATHAGCASSDAHFAMDQVEDAPDGSPA